MEFGYLNVWCGHYRILVPGENIAGIESETGRRVVRLPLRQARLQGWPLMLQARVLLGLEPAGPTAPRVNIHWRRSDDAIRAVLVVDGVDGLRSGSDDDFLPLPIVPRGFHRLFDRLAYDGDGGFLARLRHDVCLAFDDTADRRRFLRALVGAIPPEK